MRIIDTAIPDVKIVEPRVFGDDRGFFFESYNHQQVEGVLGLSLNFVQDNHSHSAKGILRGLHFQLNRPQGKLVRVVVGEVFDVAVDMRKQSKTFGKWVGVHLSAEKKNMLWIPPGFAHGFLVLSDKADFLYKTTNYYDPTSEYTLRWDDPTVAIQWPYHGKPILSEKDERGLSLAESPTFL
ncbi:MAG: dTDP-4-dehydrorhamnose 3,5-epimerase [Parachlamydiaceae bacterium]|nr:dTDP-4-dehydrorhamnose 3,5-epimerase [Parachlamydiaceae bacterium]